MIVGALVVGTFGYRVKYGNGWFLGGLPGGRTFFSLFENVFLYCLTWVIKVFLAFMTCCSVGGVACTAVRR